MPNSLSPEALERLRSIRRKLCKGKTHVWLYLGTERPIGAKCSCGKTTWKGKDNA